MFANELTEFHRFVGQQIDSGKMLSPEEALELWRDQYPEDASEDATEEIREALADVDAGDEGIPFEEFKREFRRRNNIS